MKIKQPFTPTDKKGDMPTLVLVIGIFAICVLIIFSFSWSAGYFKKGFDALHGMSRLTTTADQIRFYENIGRNPEEIPNVKKTGDVYVISAEEIQNGKRMFYAEYKIKANLQP